MGWTDLYPVSSDFGEDTKAPAAYELFFVDDSEQTPLYIGKTGNFARRMAQYARDGSHLSVEFNRAGTEHIYVRARWFATEPEAEVFESRMIEEHGAGSARYPWNTNET